jgi:MFS family permease
LHPRFPQGRPRVFYGWWIVAAGFASLFLGSGLYFHSFGAYVVALESRFGWSKTLLGGSFSLARVEGGLLGPLSGWMIDRLGPRFVCTLGFFLFGLGFILASRIDSPLDFYAAFLVVSIGTSLSGFLVVTTALNHWFRRRRALTMGMALAGTGFAGIFVPAVVWSLTAHGWVPTMVGAGIFVWIVGLPLGLVMRREPERYGQWPDGIEPAGVPEAAAGEPTPLAADEPDFTASEALRTASFWFLGLGHGLALMVVSVVSVHLIAYLQQELELSPAMSAQVVTAMTIASIGGRFLPGLLVGKVEPRYIAAVCTAGHGVAVLLLVTADGMGQALAFAVIQGASWGARGVLVNSIRGDYFGRRAFATITGYNNLITSFWQIIGPIVGGLAADITGSYGPAFYGLAIGSFIGAALYMVASRPTPPARAAAQQS